MCFSQYFGLINIAKVSFNGTANQSINVNDAILDLPFHPPFSSSPKLQSPFPARSSLAPRASLPVATWGQGIVRATQAQGFF